MQKSFLPPRAARRPVSATHHGQTSTDEFAWLRADNWQEVMRNPAALPADIRAYLEAENAYFVASMVDTEALQSTLFKEMRARTKEDDSSVPSPNGPWAYGHRFVEGGQHPLYVRLHQCDDVSYGHSGSGDQGDQQVPVVLRGGEGGF